MGRLKDQAADSTEAINAEVDCHARRSSLKQTARQMQAWVWPWQKNQCFGDANGDDQTREVRVSVPTDMPFRTVVGHTAHPPGPAGGRSVHTRGASTRNGR
jgi:hypothetical protein